MAPWRSVARTARMAAPCTVTRPSRATPVCSLPAVPPIRWLPLCPASHERAGEVGERSAGMPRGRSPTDTSIRARDDMFRPRARASTSAGCAYSRSVRSLTRRHVARRAGAGPPRFSGPSRRLCHVMVTLGQPRGWWDLTVLVPARDQLVDGLVDEFVRRGGYGSRDLFESGEAGDAIDGCPGHGGSTQDFGLGRAVGLTRGDRVVQEVPVVDRRLLQQWMVTFGDEGSVRKVVDVRLFADEGEIGIGEGVQSVRRVEAGSRHERAGADRGVGQTLAGHSRQQSSPAPEVDIGRLMADAQVLGDLAQAELVRGSVDQAVEGRLEEPRLQPFLVAGCRFGHLSPSRG